MSIIEEKVVKMVFDNSNFEKNIKTSVNSLNKFKNSLNMSSAQRSLGSLKDTVGSFNLNSLVNAAEGAGQKFSAMSTIAVGALIRIGEKAVDVGAKVIKALTIDPVLTGFNEYELKMNSVQTIMNGTGESLDVVMEKLNELNIPFEIVEHEPALTTEQADSFIEGIEGVRTKTMFLTNKKKT